MTTSIPVVGWSDLDGIWDNSDPADIAAASASLADGVRDVLEAKSPTIAIQTFRPANAAALAALSGTYTLQAGDLAYQVDTNVLYQWSGSLWLPARPSAVMRPTSVTGGTIATSGAFTSASVAIVRPTGVFTTAYSNYEVKFDITTASSTSLKMLLSASGTDTTTGYDNQRFTSVNNVPSSVQSTNTSEIITGGGIPSTRHVGVIFFDTNPATTGDTYFRVDTTVSPNPMTTAHGKYLGSGLQRATTQFNGFSFSASTGNLTVNYCSVVGSV